MYGYQEFKNPGRPEWYMRIQALVVRLLGSAKPLGKKLALLGELLNYQGWVAMQFGTSRFLGSRELVWRELEKSLPKGEQLRVLEFGVAWGYMTNWWLTNQNHRITKWDGYDRFTGLPRSWRDLDPGTFDAGGTPPPINDNRLTWHVGDIETTLGKSLVLAPITDRNRVLYVFDLDIFEPSLHCWNVIQPFLKPGDLLYFDEAFDRDERRLIEDHVLASEIRLEAIAHSTTCLLVLVC